MERVRKATQLAFLGIIIFALSLGCTPGRAQTKKNKDSRYGSKYEDRYDKEEVDADADEDFDGDNAYRKTAKRGQTASERAEENFTVEEAADVEDESGRKEKFYQTGIASWYGREFDGKPTASGENFDMNEMTAAHKTLPFGSIVEVKNLDNGKVARVRINDRGPYVGGRIIDVSYKAGKSLGMLSKGKAFVGIRIIKKGEDRTAKKKKNSRKGAEIEAVVDDSTGDEERGERDSGAAGMKLQLGAFYSKHNAEALKEKVEKMTENNVVVVKDGDLYKVRIEGIGSKRDVQKHKKMLSDKNIPSYLIENRE